LDGTLYISARPEHIRLISYFLLAGTSFKWLAPFSRIPLGVTPIPTAVNRRYLFSGEPFDIFVKEEGEINQIDLQIPVAPGNIRRVTESPFLLPSLVSPHRKLQIYRTKSEAHIAQPDGSFTLPFLQCQAGCVFQSRSARENRTREETPRFGRPAVGHSRQ
jgi:hypothetical protein